MYYRVFQSDTQSCNLCGIIAIHRTNLSTKLMSAKLILSKNRTQSSLFIREITFCHPAFSKWSCSALSQKVTDTISKWSNREQRLSKWHRNVRTGMAMTLPGKYPLKLGLDECNSSTLSAGHLGQVSRADRLHIASVPTMQSQSVTFLPRNAEIGCQIDPPSGNAAKVITGQEQGQSTWLDIQKCESSTNLTSPLGMLQPAAAGMSHINESLSKVGMVISRVLPERKIYIYFPFENVEPAEITSTGQNWKKYTFKESVSK